VADTYGPSGFFLVPGYKTAEEHGVTYSIKCPVCRGSGQAR